MEHKESPVTEPVHMLLPIDPDDDEAAAFVARQAQRCADRSWAAGDRGMGPAELEAFFEERYGVVLSDR